MLNQEQQAAKEQLLMFLADDNKFFVLDGAAGVGKTFLLNDLARTVGSDFHWTATTNKAAALLAGGKTIHKAFGFTVFNDYKTGNVVTSIKNASMLKEEVICIDESSMLSTSLLRRVDEFSPQCKIILIGDEMQLAPVGEGVIPAFAQGFETVTLTQPMRQDRDSHLYATCQALRAGVPLKRLPTVSEGEGVQIHTNMHSFLSALITQDLDTTRIVTYTNEQAIKYNNFVRKHKNMPEELGEKDWVISRRYTLDVNDKNPIGIEETGQISRVEEGGTHFNIPYKRVTVNGRVYRMPVNRNQIEDRLRMARTEKDWLTVFALQEGFADLRAGYGITAHSSQGSSYETVFVDLQNMKGCRDKDQLVRMAYVACSRSRKSLHILV